MTVDNFYIRYSHLAYPMSHSSPFVPNARLCLWFSCQALVQMSYITAQLDDHLVEVMFSAPSYSIMLCFRARTCRAANVSAQAGQRFASALIRAHVREQELSECKNHVRVQELQTISCFSVCKRTLWPLLHSQVCGRCAQCQAQYSRCGRRQETEEVECFLGTGDGIGHAMVGVRLVPTLERVLHLGLQGDSKDLFA